MNRKKPMKAITMIELGVAGVLLLVLVLLVYWYTDGLASYHPNGETHQYVKGMKIDYTDSAVFREQDGSVYITEGSSKMPAIDVPIVHTGSTDLTLTRNMAVYAPNNGSQISKVNSFTTVSEKDGRTTFAVGKKSASQFGGFLFDGEDLYIFLEDVVLTVGNGDYPLPAMSYVKVRYGDSVEYHNSQTDEDKVIGIDGVDVIAKTSSYSLELDKDVLKKGSNKELLFSAIDVLTTIELE